MPTRYTSLATKLGLTIGTTLVVGTSVLIGTTLRADTSINAPIVYSSGGLLPVTANLTESNVEGNGTNSGWTIQNPYSEAILCDRVTLRTSIAPTDGSTVVDIGTGTGTHASGAGSGNTLTDSYTIAAEVHTSSGSAITDSDGYVNGLVLDAAGGTTDYFMIYQESGSGGGIAADFHARCYSFD